VGVADLQVFQGKKTMTEQSVKFELYFKQGKANARDRVGIRVLKGRRRIPSVAEMPLHTSTDIVRVFETTGRAVAKMVEDQKSVILNANGNLV
jgi:hypothetical protein